MTVLPLTSDLRNAPLVRVTIEPQTTNGLLKSSQVMVDKAVTVPRSKIGRRIGAADGATLMAVDAALARFLGLT